MVVQTRADSRKPTKNHGSAIADIPTASELVGMLNRLADRITTPDDIADRVRSACEHVIRVCPTAVSGAVELVVDGVTYRYSLTLPTTIDAASALATTPVTVAGSASGRIDVVSALALDNDSASMLRSIAYALGSPATAYVKMTAAQAIVDDLRAAMNKRAPIEQAKGMLMAAHQVDADAAFDMLVTRSQRENRKVRDIASDIIGAFTKTGSVQPPKAATLVRVFNHGPS